MELDFSFIEGSTAEKRPSKMSAARLSEQGEYKTTSEAEKRAEGPETPQESNAGETVKIGALERAAKDEKHKKEAAAEVFRTYQQNIKTSGQLQTDILKGVKAGEDMTALFLKACKAIALMVDNPLFYDQVEEDLAAIYGAGLGQPYPLKKELEEVRERLQRLMEAQQRETEPEDSRQRIAAAIRAHEVRAGELEALLARGRT